MMTNLVEGVQRECERWREWMVGYDQIEAHAEIGPAMALKRSLIEEEICDAEAAMASGDVVKMLQAYQALSKRGPS